MSSIAFAVRPCAVVTCARHSPVRWNMCGRACALRERPRPRCAMCDERRRRLAPGHVFCYLCRSDDNAERARRLRAGRLAQSPRRLQSLAAPALQAGHGVQGNSAEFDPRRGLGSHTPRILDADRASVPRGCISLYFGVTEHNSASIRCWIERVSRATRRLSSPCHPMTLPGACELRVNRVDCATGSGESRASSGGKGHSGPCRASPALSRRRLRAARHGRSGPRRPACRPLLRVLP